MWQSGARPATRRPAVRIILPKTVPNLYAFQHVPLFFLAGPIRGGGDWQREMTELLGKRGECVVVNPSRYEPDHPLYQYRLEGSEHFAHQTAWERFYLHLAAKDWSSGCIIFWLACESKENPRDDGQPYARDTYGELGEWRGRLLHDPKLRVIVGAEPDFPGLAVIRRNFEDAVGSSFRIYDTMEEVVERAAYLLHQDDQPGYAVMQPAGFHRLKT